MTNTRTRNAVDGAVRGALAGGMAALTMTAAMFAAKSAGLMGEMPPEKIAASALEKVGLSNHHVLQDVVASALHITFGAGAGALYGALDEGVALPGPALLKGVGFGTAIWTVSYAGWVPALGIMAMPDKDRRGRPQSMLVAHWVYGAALTMILSRLHQRKPTAEPARSKT